MGLGLDLSGLDFFGGGSERSVSDASAITSNTTATGAGLSELKEWLKFGVGSYLTIDAVRKGHAAMGNDGNLYDPMNNPTNKPLVEQVKSVAPLLLLAGVGLIVFLVVKD